MIPLIFVLFILIPALIIAIISYPAFGIALGLFAWFLWYVYHRGHQEARKWKKDV